MAKSRRPKYSPQIQQTICDAIAVEGTEQAGFQAANISKASYYKWKKEIRDFRIAVELALEEYTRTCPASLRRAARNVISDYVNRRYARVRKTVKETVREVRPEDWQPDDPGANQTRHMVEVHTETTTMTSYHACPQWVIDRILGPPLDELSAVKALVNAGLLPSWIGDLTVAELDKFTQTIKGVFAGELPAGEGSIGAAGISDTTWAAARAQFMGLQPPDPAALPAALGERSQSD